MKILIQEIKGVAKDKLVDILTNNGDSTMRILADRIKKSQLLMWLPNPNTEK